VGQGRRTGLTPASVAAGLGAAQQQQEKGEGNEEVYDSDLFINSQQQGSGRQNGAGLPSDGSFEAGTWLFDCGECTQVRSRALFLSISEMTLFLLFG